MNNKSKEDILIVKDLKKVTMEKGKRFGITTMDNLNDDAVVKFHDTFTFDTKILKDAIDAMNTIADNIEIYIPKEEYPLMLIGSNNTETPVFIIAPISLREVKDDT